MPRLPRLVIPGVPLHVVQRGNNRGTVFFEPDDYRYYCQLLLDTSRRFECAIHAYVLMTNHVHLLITPQDERGPARMVQTLGRSFVPAINARRGRTGTLWEGRYKSMVIAQDQYFLTCSRYIELNPVRAGMVERPGHYAWSSYRHNAQAGVDPLITEHPLYRMLGAQPPDRRLAYRALFDAVLDPNAIDVIRSATLRGTPIGEPTTTDRFPCETRVAHGGDRRSIVFRTSRARFQQL